MKNRILISPLMAVVLVLIIANACCKDDDDRTGRTTAIFNPNKTYGTVKDIDENVYKTITIGTQTWMAENLRTTRYRNGEVIPNITGKTDVEQWGNLTTGAYCTYNNTTNPDSIATFGRLYNWYAATDSRSIAPEGWHVPSDAEWTALITTVDAGDGNWDQYGDNSIAGGRLKEAGGTHWGYFNVADNSSGFTALPGGERSNYFGSFYDIGFSCNFWSTSEFVDPSAFYRTISSPFLTIIRQGTNKSFGKSVRCLKD